MDCNITLLELVFQVEDSIMLVIIIVMLLQLLSMKLGGICMNRPTEINTGAKWLVTCTWCFTYLCVAIVDVCNTSQLLVADEYKRNCLVVVSLVLAEILAPVFAVVDYSL